MAAKVTPPPVPSLCRRCFHPEADHRANHCTARECRDCRGYEPYTAKDLEVRYGLQPGANGSDVLAGANRQAAIALRDVVLHRASEARHDRAKFFEFVMRTEKGRKPMRIQPHQRLAQEFLAAHHRMVFMWSVEHSKCHGVGTPILMADATTKPVEQVRKGDRVMGPDGPKLVTGAAAGKGDLFLVTPTKGGDPFVANADHILTLVKTPSSKRGKHAPARVIDISLRDFLRMSPSMQREHKLFRVGVRKFDGEEYAGVDPYFLGVWFGDGRHSVGESICVTNIDPEVRAACRETADNWGLTAVDRDEQSFKLIVPHKGNPKAHGNPLLKHLRELVGPGLSMERMKRMPWGDRAEFLAGFIDADGCVRDNCAYVAQKRHDWAEAIAFIARSLGLSVTIKPMEVKGYGEYRRLCIYGEMDRVPTRIARKKFSPRTKKQEALRTGFKVEPLGEDVFYGFTVGGDGRYLLGDFTVTHNTTLLVCEILADLGENPESRGVFLCYAQEQSGKVVRAVRDYIEASPELRLVYPKLRPSQRAGDPWTGTTLVIDRPRGIKDPTLYAIGLDGQIQGSRLTRAYVDDLLNRENTATPEQRARVAAYVHSSVLDRMLWEESTKVVVSNVPWHPKDLVHAFTEPDQGGRWPLLRMSMEGDITIRDDEDKRRLARDFDLPWSPFDSDLLRPAHPDDATDLSCRLVANDPDPENKKPLWPAQFPPERIAQLKGETLPFEYNRKYKCLVRDDDDAMCKQDYIDKCMEVARRLGIKSLTGSYEGSNPVFLGLDLAVSPGEEADDTAFFTFEVRPDGTRVILDIDFGKMSGPDILAKLLLKIERYKVSCARVENNGCQQYIIDFALEKNIALPIKAHMTGRAKAHPEHGVPGVFLELSHGAWAIPNVDKVLHPRVKRFVDACLYYVPSKHTDDVLMAAYFGREQARSWGLNGPHSPTDPNAPGVGVNIMAR